MTVKRPEETAFSKLELTRKYPATERLSPEQRNSLDDLTQRYIRFLGKAWVPNLVVDEVIELVINKGYTNEAHAKEPFYLLGPDEKSFAVVKPGIVKNQQDPLENGLRVIVSHVDAPCLVAKQRPLFFEWDPGEKELYPGVCIDTYPYGGIQHYHWEGIPVYFIGSGVVDGKRYEKMLQGMVVGQSAHLDQRHSETTMGEAFTHDNIKVFLGHASRKDALKELGFKSEDDFYTTVWYAVPKIKPTRIGRDFISAYGHDDRAGTFGAVDALLKAKAETNTLVIIGFDYEEVGSDGAGGAKGRFFDEVIDTIVRSLESKLSKEEVIRRSKGISADTDVTSGPHENTVSGIIDKRNVSRLGYGVSMYSATGLYENNNVPLDYKAHIRRLAEKRKIPVQLLGSPQPADIAMGAETVGYFLTNRGLYSIDAGPTVVSSHGLNELLHAGDLFWSRELYQAFFEDKTPYKPIRKAR